MCYKSGVRVVTIYAFSIENFKRSRYEVDALMSLAKLKLTQLAQHGDLLSRYGARIQILGQRSLVAPDVLEAIDRAVDLTKGNGDAILNVCFPYTSQDEITSAVRGCVEDYSRPISAGHGSRGFSEAHISHNIRARHLTTAVTSLRGNPPSSAGTSDTEESMTTASSSTNLQPSTPPDFSTLDSNESRKGGFVFGLGVPYRDPEAITVHTLDNHMFTAGMPPLELLIRTSGVERLSDFMLWQAHEDTEIVFLDCLWPEFDLWTFLPVLVEWQWRRRRRESRVLEETVHSQGRIGRLWPSALDYHRG